MSMDFTGFLVAIAPLLFLIASLLLGRYPGERAIARFVHFVDSIQRRTVRQVLPDGLDSRALPARTGDLIASSLAGRAPPFARHVLQI